MSTDLTTLRCKPREGAPLPEAEIRHNLAGLEGWSLEGGAIGKTYKFPDHHHTMAFVNAVAWISHREDHHPDLAVGYDRCTVRYSTHSVGGISINDFICAAKVDALLV